MGVELKICTCCKPQQVLHPIWYVKGMQGVSLCLQFSIILPPTSFCASQVGFRQDEIKGRQLLHNNQPIMIKGVNRHMHEDRRGKAVTEESMLADIKLLKQLNFNAVRNAHYPNNNRW